MSSIFGLKDVYLVQQQHDNTQQQHSTTTLNNNTQQQLLLLVATSGGSVLQCSAVLLCVVCCVLCVVATSCRTGEEEKSVEEVEVPTNISMVLLRSGKTFDGSNITEACRGSIVVYYDVMSED
jgi:hypothetical protein